MDKLESLGNTLSNLTMYDIKSMYTQVRSIFPDAASVICWHWGHGIILIAAYRNTIGEKCGFQRQ